MEKQVILKMEQEIMCTGCAEDLETVLREKDGILDVSVSYVDNTITVKYDPDELDERQILSLVMKMGFKSKKTDVPET